MAAPTFVEENETAWNNTTTPKTDSVTLNSGDVLAILAGTETGGVIANTPTGGTGLTYTLQQSVVIDNNWSNAYCWTCIGVGTETFTLSLTRPTTPTGFFGFNALRFSGSDGVGASAKTNSASGNAQVSITTTQANSAIAVIIIDWNAVAVGTPTWVSATAGAGITVSATNATQMSVIAGYYADAGAAGVKTVGITAPTGTKFSIIAVEIKGTAGAPPSFNPKMSAFMPFF